MKTLRHESTESYRRHCVEQHLPTDILHTARKCAAVESSGPEPKGQSSPAPNEKSDLVLLEKRSYCRQGRSENGSHIGCCRQDHGRELLLCQSRRPTGLESAATSSRRAQFR